MDVSNVTAGAIDPAARVAAAQRNVEPASGTKFQKLVDQASAGDMWGEVDAAGRAASDMHARGRELHFSIGEHGKVAIQVRDLQGGVIRSVPISETLDFASGKVSA